MASRSGDGILLRIPAQSVPAFRRVAANIVVAKLVGAGVAIVIVSCNVDHAAPDDGSANTDDGTDDIDAVDAVSSSATFSASKLVSIFTIIVIDGGESFSVHICEGPIKRLIVGHSLFGTRLFVSRSWDGPFLQVSQHIGNRYSNSDRRDDDNDHEVVAVALLLYVDHHCQWKVFM